MFQRVSSYIPCEEHCQYIKAQVYLMSFLSSVPPPVHSSSIFISKDKFTLNYHDSWGAWGRISNVDTKDTVGYEVALIDTGERVYRPPSYIWSYKQAINEMYHVPGTGDDDNDDDEENNDTDGNKRETKSSQDSTDKKSKRSPSKSYSTKAKKRSPSKSKPAAAVATSRHQKTLSFFPQHPPPIENFVDDGEDGIQFIPPKKEYNTTKVYRANMHGRPLDEESEEEEGYQSDDDDEEQKMRARARLWFQQMQVRAAQKRKLQALLSSATTSKKKQKKKSNKKLKAPPKKPPPKPERNVILSGKGWRETVAFKEKYFGPGIIVYTQFTENGRKYNPNIPLFSFSSVNVLTLSCLIQFFL